MPASREKNVFFAVSSGSWWYYACAGVPNQSPPPSACIIRRGESIIASEKVCSGSPQPIFLAHSSAKSARGKGEITHVFILKLCYLRFVLRPTPLPSLPPLPPPSLPPSLIPSRLLCRNLDDDCFLRRALAHSLGGWCAKTYGMVVRVD